MGIYWTGESTMTMMATANLLKKETPEVIYLVKIGATAQPTPNGHIYRGPSVEDAMRQAKLFADVFTRRNESAGIWVIKMWKLIDGKPGEGEVVYTGRTRADE